MTERKSNNSSIGERALSKNQLIQILPTYNELVGTVTSLINEDLKEKKDNKKNKEAKETKEEYKSSIHNVFSILGPRGSGKSSVFHSVYKELNDKIVEEEYIVSKCIVFEPIVPEKAEKSMDIFGLVLLQISAYLEKMKGTFREKETSYKSCLKQEESQIEKSFNKVFETYYKRNPVYRRLLSNHYTTKKEFNESIKNVFKAEISLADDFKNFINDLLIATGKNKVVFMFDDIDLSPSRANEVLDMLLKYLDSENIITFISADEEKLNENLRIHFFKDHEVLEHIDKETQDKGKIKESINEYVYDLLKKIMPPIKRFPLIELKKGAILEFCYDYIDEKEQKFEELLRIFLSKNYSKLSESIRQIYPKEEYVGIFADLFDNRPRGLMNICSYISGLNEKMKDNDLSSREYAELMDLIITTNRKIEKNRDIIHEFISIKDQGDVVLNFNVLTSKLQSSSFEISNQEKETFYIILKLSFFMMFIMGKNERNGVKYAEILNLIFSSSYTSDLYPRVDDIWILFFLTDEISRITGFHNQFMMLRNENFKQDLSSFIDENESWITDTVWLKEFKSEKSSNLIEIIKSYEGIEYDPSILMNIVHLNNSSSEAKNGNEKKIDEVIEIEALSILFQDMISNYDRENASSKYNFSGLVEELEKRNRVIRIDDYYLAKYSKINYDQYVDTSLVDFMENINIGTQIVHELTRYMNGLKKDYLSYYTGSALSRVNNYILRNYDEVFVEYTINNVDKDTFGRFSKSSKWLSEKALKNYVDQQLERQNSLSNTQVDKAINAKDKILRQEDHSDYGGDGRLNDNIRFLVDYLDISYNSEITYIELDETVGHSSTHTMVRRYLDRILNAYAIEEIFLPEFMNLILTLQEEMMKFIVGSLVNKLELKLDIEEEEKFEEDYPQFVEELYEYVEEITEHIDSLMEVFILQGKPIDKEKLKKSSAIIKELDVRLTPLNMNINLLNDVAKYSTNAVVTENANSIVDKIIKNGYILLDELKEFVEHVKNLIHRQSNNINDMKVCTLIDEIEKQVNTVEEKYESDDSLVKLEKKVWKAYKNALTDEVKKAMIADIESEKTS